MKPGQIVGLILFIGGIILISLYATVEGLRTIDIATIPLLILVGVGVIIIGVIALLISIVFEQTSDMKKRKEEIKEEDFEP